MHLLDSIPVRTDIDVLGDRGKTVLSYSKDSNGAASNVHFFLYRPISDTSKPFSDPDVRMGLNSTVIEKEVTYYNALGNNERVDFFYGDSIKERLIVKYNLRNKIMCELDFSFPKKRYVFRTTYQYNDQGILTEKKIEDIENELTKRYFYKQGLVVREEYIYSGRLDHAIDYSYSSIGH